MRLSKPQCTSKTVHLILAIQIKHGSGQGKKISSDMDETIHKFQFAESLMRDQNLWNYVISYKLLNFKIRVQLFMHHIDNNQVYKFVHAYINIDLLRYTHPMFIKA